MIQPTPQYPRPDDTVIANSEANSKSFIYQTSYDPGRFHDTFGTMMQYVSGTPIRVTYYKQILSDNLERTAFADTDFVEDDSHIDLEQILNFEFRTESQFNFSWDSDKGMATFSGEGITYPGFEPTVGDMFLYKIHDAFGIFVLTHVEPLSLRQGAYHRINFILRSRLNDSDRKTLLSRVRSSSVFDIQKCLGEKLTLLKHEKYIALEKLREIRVSLSKYYNHIFYDELIDSYIRPDGVYDPYVVKYMLKKNDSFIIKRRPMQLVIIDDYLDTIWSMFTDIKHSNIAALKQVYTTSKKIDNIFGTQINGLMNREYVVLLDSMEDIQSNNNNTNNTHTSKKDKLEYQINRPDPIFGIHKEDNIDEEAICDTDEAHTHHHIYYYKPNIHHNHNHTFFKQPSCGTTIPPCLPRPIIPVLDKDDVVTVSPDGYYIFDNVFYNGLTSQMSIFEKLVYEYISTGNIDVDTTVYEVSKYRKLSKDRLFYNGPLYIGLIDAAIAAIT